jgi:hypothetical protein
VRHHIAAFAPNCLFFDVHQEVLFTEAKLNAKMLSSAHVVLMTPVLSIAQNCLAPELMLVGQAVALAALELLSLKRGSTLGLISPALDFILVGQAVALEAVEALEALALMLSSAPWLCAVALRRDSLSSTWLTAIPPEMEGRILDATVVSWTRHSRGSRRTEALLLRLTILTSPELPSQMVHARMPPRPRRAR